MMKRKVESRTGFIVGGGQKEASGLKLNYEPIRNLRRSIFSSMDFVSGEYSIPNHSVCVIRFPLDVAIRLRESNTTENDEVKSDIPTHWNGVQIKPTNFEDFRIFEINAFDRSYIGLLVDLPCAIEVFKSLDWDMMFKGADIAQMIYVYNPAKPPSFYHYKLSKKTQMKFPFPHIDLKATNMYDNEIFCGFLNYVKNILKWEWPTGLTAATHRIRSRKFRSNEVFDVAEVLQAEDELLEFLSSSQRDTVEIELVSNTEMSKQLHMFRYNNKNMPFPIPSSDELLNNATCMGIIGKDDDLSSLILRSHKINRSYKSDPVLAQEDVQSDVSDVMFRESDTEDNQVQVDNDNVLGKSDVDFVNENSPNQSWEDSNNKKNYHQHNILDDDDELGLEDYTYH